MRWALFCLTIVAGTGLVSGAQSPDDRFAMWMEPPQIMRPAGQATVDVYLSTAADGVQGWSFGIEALDSTDGTITVKIVGAAPGSDLLTAGPNGGEPSFLSCSLKPAGTECGTPCPDCIGVTQGVVLDFLQETFLDTTDRFQCLRLTVDVQGSAGGEPGKLGFTNTLGSPPVKTLVVLGGDSFPPAVQAGTDLYIVECESNYYPHISDVQGALDTEQEVGIYLDFDHEGTADFAVQAWSIGVRHDSSALELVDVTIDGTDTIAAKNGEEPDFTQFKFIPAPPPEATDGFTHGVVLDFQASITLSPVNDFLDCRARYRLVGEPPCPDSLVTELVPVGDLGQPVVRMVVVVEGESRIPCEVGTGTVTILCAVPFLRGDANGDRRVDIADGIFVFYYLFRQGAEPPCADAADANDDGQIDASDAIYIVNYQFLDGPPPPPPFPQEGLDPTEDELPDC